MVSAAAGDDRTLSLLVAIGFAACVVAGTLRLNALSRRNMEQGHARADLASLNAGLLAVAFAWGGLAILASYYLTDLFWHHAWQYGLGMCLASLMAFGLRWHLERPDCFLRQFYWLQRLTWLSGLLAVGTAAGLVFLVASGKLARDNVDWIANHVFVAGGLAIMAISAISVWEQRRTHLERNHL